LDTYITICQKFKATWKEKAEKHMMTGYVKYHSADTYIMCNPKTRKIRETCDVYTWAPPPWNRVLDPKWTHEHLQPDPKLLIARMGLDAVEVTVQLETPEIYFHLILDDVILDSKVGRKKPGEEPTEERKQEKFRLLFIQN
jgi:hypothetical protein